MAHAFIRLCAVLIGVRAFTNFAKLLQGEEAVLVLFGQILRGSDVAIPALIVGAFMLVTAVGMWTGARWAVPLAVVYAGYVMINLGTWTLMNPGELERVGMRFSSATDPAELRRIGALGFLGYCIVAIATTALPAWLLWRRRS